MTRTDLLVIGAGPYAYAAAAYARDQGIATHVVGHPMAFWRDQMPEDMYLRSGPDWHLDASGEHTFEAFFEDRGLDPADHDPIPIGVFLDHTDWFREQKSFDVDERLVAALAKPNGTFEATMDDGSTIEADTVLAAPGHPPLRQPAGVGRRGAAEARRPHTTDLVTFDEPRRRARGRHRRPAERLRVGGAALRPRRRQRRRRAPPRDPGFAEVSWAFCDAYVEQTLANRGWWRGADRRAEQQAIARSSGRSAGSPWSTGWCRGWTRRS